MKPMSRSMSYVPHYLDTLSLRHLAEEVGRHSQKKQETLPNSFIGFDPKKMGQMMAGLMKRLGYEKYVVQGNVFLLSLLLFLFLSFLFFRSFVLLFFFSRSFSPLFSSILSLSSLLSSFSLLISY